MINNILEIIEKYKKCKFKDEDNLDLSISLNKGATIEDVCVFERKNNIQIPEDFKNFILYSNGLNLFGVEILSLEELDYLEEAGVLIFHNWGNGDFDCLAIKNNFDYGNVIFMNHSIDKLFKVTSTFTEWVFDVVKEVKDKGVILHPDDFFDREEDGIYKNINRICHK